MRIKGKGKKAQPLPLNPHHHSTTHTLGSLSCPSKFFHKSLLTKTTSEQPPPHPRSAENTSSRPRSAFSLQPETNLFGKLRAVQNGTTHSLRAFNCWGQADTHTHTHSHTLAHTLSHKMAALTKISSPPKAAYELNYHLCSAQSQSPPAHLVCASDTVLRSCVDVINRMNLIVYKFHLASRQGSKQ